MNTSWVCLGLLALLLAAVVHAGPGPLVVNRGASIDPPTAPPIAP